MALPPARSPAIQAGFQESQAAQLAYYESAAGGGLSPRGGGNCNRGGLSHLRGALLRGGRARILQRIIRGWTMTTFSDAAYCPPLSPPCPRLFTAPRRRWPMTCPQQRAHRLVLRVLSCERGRSLGSLCAARSQYRCQERGDAVSGLCEEPVLELRRGTDLPATRRCRRPSARAPPHWVRCLTTVKSSRRPGGWRRRCCSNTSSSARTRSFARTSASASTTPISTTGIRPRRAMPPAAVPPSCR